MARRDPNDPLPPQKLKPWRIRRECENRDIEVEVRVMLRDGGIEFSATAELGTGEKVRHADSSIEELWRKMHADVGASEPVVWERMLIVEVNNIDANRTDENDDGAGLRISYDQIQCGRAGRLRFRRRADDSKIEKGWPRTGNLENCWSHGAKSVSLIPDTPANRATLKAMVKGIEKISERVREMMAPGNIAGTLENARKGVPLLGASK